MTTAAPMSAADRTPHERFVFEHADWEFYQSVLAKLGDRRVFVTFDGERLEVMSPSYWHDKSAELLALIVRTAAVELGVPVTGAGSMTLSREFVNRGLEPDRCFYVKNEAATRGKRELDLNVDPPPDLAIECEISVRLDKRLGIYAALGVHELWRFDGRRLRVEVLGTDGTYRAADRSPSFPSLPLDRVEQWIDISPTMDETAWLVTVRQWIRDNLAAS